jgi:glycosyltransferase involved in cell wall biosynthesis
VGGLFRHVHDLARGQAELGLDAGLICAAGSVDSETERALSRVADACALGVRRLPMTRRLGMSDWHAYWQVTRMASSLGIDVLHGHGTKGGAYARLAGHALARRDGKTAVFYTPHGGSLHYSRATLIGRVYIAAERRLARYTDGLIFESAFAAARYGELIGEPRCEAHVIPNGLYPFEFYEPQLAEDAADFVFVDELRQLKGVDVLLEALASDRTIYPARAVIVGSGPDEAELKRTAKKLGLAGKVIFSAAQSSRAAFARGRCVVVPSRAESLPYIVLEAAAAQMPLIATDVGGIPEIVSGSGMQLVPPGNAGALAAQLRAFLANPQPFLERARALQKRVAERFGVETMTQAVVDFYRAVLATRT